MNDAPTRVSMAPVFVLAQLETLINHLLLNAPVTQQRLRALAGMHVHVRITLPRLDVHVMTDGEQVRLSHHAESSADVTIEGSAAALVMRLLAGGDLRSGGPIKIEGDPTRALQWLQLAQELDIDWEDMLARHVGDVAAHQIGEGLRAGRRFLGSLWGKALRDGRTFLVNESQTLASPADFERFSNDVHALRQDYDRLEARVMRLRSQWRPGE